MSLENFYFFVCGAVLVSNAITFWISFLIPGMNQWNKRFFVILFADSLLYMISAFVDLLVYTDPSMSLVEEIVAYFEYLLLSIRRLQNSRMVRDSPRDFVIIAFFGK